MEWDEFTSHLVRLASTYGQGEGGAGAGAEDAMSPSSSGLGEGSVLDEVVAATGVRLDDCQRDV